MTSKVLQREEGLRDLPPKASLVRPHGCASRRASARLLSGSRSSQEEIMTDRDDLYEKALCTRHRCERLPTQTSPTEYPSLTG
jgi:hypothetical protein